MTENEKPAAGKKKTTLKDRFKNRARPRRPWFAVMGAAVLAACFLTVFAVKQLTTQNLGGEVKTAAVKREVETTPGGNATRKYRRTVKEQNKRQAREAEKREESYIATVSGSKQSGNVLEHKQKPEEKEKEQTVEKKKQKQKDGNAQKEKVDMLQQRINEMKAQMRQMRQKSRRRESRDNTRQMSQKFENLAQKYSNQMANLSSELKQGRAEQEIYVYEDVQTGPAEKKKTGSNATEKTGPARPALSLSPGDILYARNELKLNSDVPSPAQATVVSTEYRGAKLMGGFQKQGGHLLVQFDRMIMPDGREYAIKAYAINPEVPATAVRSDIDRHTLQRWGGLVAASFLRGFGEAVSQSGTTTVQSNGNTVTTHPELDTREQLWAAGGQVGKKLESKFAKKFNRPATVTLVSGKNIGVLFLSAGNSS